MFTHRAWIELKAKHIPYSVWIGRNSSQQLKCLFIYLQLSSNCAHLPRNYKKVNLIRLPQVNCYSYAPVSRARWNSADTLYNRTYRMLYRCHGRIRLHRRNHPFADRGLCRNIARSYPKFSRHCRSRKRLWQERRCSSWCFEMWNVYIKIHKKLIET